VLRLTMLSAVILPMIAGCQATTGTECAGWRPIYPSRSDTPGTLEQVKAHNRQGEEQGCWRPPGK
jgi:hypothetical protein